MNTANSVSGSISKFIYLSSQPSAMKYKRVAWHCALSSYIKSLSSNSSLTDHHMLKINISPTCQQYAVVIEAMASRSDIELERTRSAFQLSSQPWCCIILVGSSISFFFLSQTLLIHLGDVRGEAGSRGRANSSDGLERARLKPTQRAFWLGVMASAAWWLFMLSTAATRD